MPSDFWEQWAEDNNFDWDEVSSIHVFRDDSGWTVGIETDTGEFVSLSGELTDEEAEEYIWDDLYYWAQEYEIDFDKEIEYAAD